MRRQVTLNHLARQLGLHHTTVSMALRNSSEISERTRERVQSLARRWRYTPNHIARSLRQRSTRTLGVIFPSATLPYHATLLSALDAEADSRGLHLEIHFHQWSETQETNAVRTLVERRVDGLILMAATHSWFQKMGDVLSNQVEFPVVVMGYPLVREKCPFLRGYVATDMREGSRQLGEYLISMGHRQIALLLPAAAESSANLQMRVDGIRAALQNERDAELILVQREENDAPRRTGIGWGNQPSFDLNRALADQFLQLSPRPTVVVTTDEPAAHVLLSELSARGLRVPEDVSLACYDGTFLSAYGAVPVTCVAQPFDQLARNAIELITQDATGNPEASPEIRVVHPTLIPRASVARILGEEQPGTHPGCSGHTVTTKAGHHPAKTKGEVCQR